MTFETKCGNICLIHMADSFVNIGLLQLVIDAMLFVLIWIVQLVVYPGFCYYNNGDLRKWHQNYTWRISTIVMSLMLGQLMLYSYSSYTRPSPLNLVILALIILVWMITFLMAVPLHQRIDKGVKVKETSNRLVTINWARTIIWTLIFIISMVNYGK